MRATLSLLGLALGILVTVGFGWGAAPWLVRLDLVVALASVGAVLLRDDAPGAIAAAPVVIAGVLGIAGLAGLQGSAERWLCWASICFAIGYLIVAVVMPPVGAAAPVRAPLPVEKHA